MDEIAINKYLKKNYRNHDQRKDKQQINFKSKIDSNKKYYIYIYIQIHENFTNQINLCLFFQNRYRNIKIKFTRRRESISRRYRHES